MLCSDFDRPLEDARYPADHGGLLKGWHKTEADHVVNVKGRFLSLLREAAVLTTIAGSLNHKPSGTPPSRPASAESAPA